MRSVLDPLTQDVDRAAFGDLALQAGQETAARGPVVVELQCVDQMLLRGAEKAAELDEIDAVFAVVVRRIAEEPTGAAGDGNGGLGGDMRGDEDVGTPCHRADD